jgi:hypothetical protein
VKVELTKEQCKSLAEWIELRLLDEIRRDDEIDNLYWVKEMIEAFETLETAVKEI